MKSKVELTSLEVNKSIPSSVEFDTALGIGSEYGASKIDQIETGNHPRMLVNYVQNKIVSTQSGTNGSLPSEQSNSKEIPGKNHINYSIDPLAIESKTVKDEIKEDEEIPSFWSDVPSILLLFLLYILQGIPLGILSTIPFLLQARNVPYTEQARFSLAYWPFSLKVLYAPIVDAFYIKRFGRRKTWLIPLQYLIAVFLFVLSFKVDEMLDSAQVIPLTVVFFILNFLAASQDITVDGWALTMLHPSRVAHAATCNAVGQTLGGVIAYSGFLALNSADFANKFRSIPQSYGFVELSDFMMFWSIIFAITTTGILIFKKEEAEPTHIAAQHLNIVASYLNLWKILKLKNILYLIVFQLTVKIGDAPTNAMVRLKLADKGVPKEWIAFFAIPLIPFKLLVPLIISKFTVGPRPMSLYILAVPFNLLLGIILPIVVMVTPYFKDENGEFSWNYYIMLFCVFALQLIPSYTQFVSAMAFAAKISDPAIGGTYMTLINTIANIGGMWPSTVALSLVEFVGFYVKACSGLIYELFHNATSTFNSTLENDFGYENGTFNTGSVQLNNSLNFMFQQNSTNNFINSSHFQYNEFMNKVYNGTMVNGTLDEANCWVKIDGYYVESVFCVIFGIFWLFWGRPTILRLQSKPLSTWRVFK